MAELPTNSRASSSAEPPSSLKYERFVSAFFLVTPITLSLIWLAILLLIGLFGSSSGFRSVSDLLYLAIPFVQVAVLWFIWRRLGAARSWWMVALGIAIGLGFYLLTFGLCTTMTRSARSTGF